MKVVRFQAHHGPASAVGLGSIWMNSAHGSTPGPVRDLLRPRNAQWRTTSRAEEYNSSKALEDLGHLHAFQPQPDPVDEADLMLEAQTILRERPPQPPMPDRSGDERRGCEGSDGSAESTLVKHPRDRKKHPRDGNEASEESNGVDSDSPHISGSDSTASRPLALPDVEIAEIGSTDTSRLMHITGLLSLVDPVGEQGEAAQSLESVLKLRDTVTNPQVLTSVIWWIGKCPALTAAMHNLLQAVLQAAQPQLANCSTAALVDMTCALGELMKALDAEQDFDEVEDFIDDLLAEVSPRVTAGICEELLVHLFAAAAQLLYRSASAEYLASTSQMQIARSVERLGPRATIKCLDAVIHMGLGQPQQQSFCRALVQHAEGINLKLKLSMLNMGEIAALLQAVSLLSMHVPELSDPDTLLMVVRFVRDISFEAERQLKAITLFKSKDDCWYNDEDLELPDGSFRRVVSAP